ncbi:MAG: hypothetical protein BM558_10800 [Roseobacter sp. MedPE-SW]|nr:MAG: hypothetical protein BM558_10800 [Roseobacter sp. MedPE-SW]
METKQHAVIYAHVSSVAQLKKGDGLASQESRCRECARYKGYEVLEVFNDNKSGGDADHPAMNCPAGVPESAKGNLRCHY